MTGSLPTIVAHRGFPERFPENTLLGIEAAIKAGAKAIEFDVQMSFDKIPILFHDDTLNRMTGIDGTVMDMPLTDLIRLSAHYPERFGDKYIGTRVSSLAQFVEFMQDYREIIIFVEIKEESLRHFGCRIMMDKVFEDLKPIREQCIIISFDKNALEYCRETDFAPTNWVVRKYNEQSRAIAEALQPDYLCCKIQKVFDHGHDLWPGNWQWMLYETNDPQLVMQCFAAGAHFVETDNIGELLPRIKESAYGL